MENKTEGNLKHPFQGGVRLFLYFSMLMLMFGCKPEPQHNRSFCFWKTSLNITNEEDTLLKQLGVDHLYVRLFDVDWNPYEQEAKPVATISSSSYCENISQDITPCIFITNTVLEKCKTAELDSLAGRIKNRTMTTILELALRYANHEAYRIASRTGLRSDHYMLAIDSIEKVEKKIFHKKVKEILIDCDWTAQTQKSYFYLLKQLKKQFGPIPISATVRLWQYKYRDKAGIPPVDRCLLMCYSLESPKGYEVNNSISSLEEIKKYIIKEPYPLACDIALPLFNWGVLFRSGNFMGLISRPDTRIYDYDTANYKKLGPDRYMFRTNMVINNTYIRYGDEIRIEQVKPGELEKITAWLNKKIKTGKDSRITFFSLDTAYINQYGVENLRKYYRILGH